MSSNSIVTQFVIQQFLQIIIRTEITSFACTVSDDCKLSASALLFRGSTGLDNLSYVGYVNFEQTTNKTRWVSISGYVQGLTPGLHGFHIHELGKLEDCIAVTDYEALDAARNTKYDPLPSIFEHFNPRELDHGAPKANNRHAGDLGNIKAGASGVAEFTKKDNRISLYGAESIIGRLVVVHAALDNLNADTDLANVDQYGNAGALFACGVVGVTTNRYNPMGSHAKHSKSAYHPELLLLLLLVTIVINRY